MPEKVDFDVSTAIEKVIGKLEVWYETFLEMLPNMGVAIILMIFFYFTARVAKKLFKKVFAKSSDNKALESLFATIIYYTIIGVGLFVILGVLKLEKTVTSLLAGVGVLGLALGFAFQDITANFISGVILAFRKPFKIGDIVEIQDQMGTVTRTNLRVTVIKTFQGQEVYIPNKEVLQDSIKNYSILGERRIDLACGVSYGDDLKKVRELVLKTIGDLEGVIREQDMIFTYTEFGSSSINFEIKFWISYPDDPGYLSMRTKAIEAIKEAFDANDITIPFPIRTLDFGIKGGEKLSEMKLQAASLTND